jgi:hypothetical protein
MKKILLCSILVTSGLLALSDDENSSVKTDKFMNKYVKTDSKSYKYGESTLSDSTRNKLSENVDLSEIAKANKEHNKSEYRIDLTTSHSMEEQAKRIANSVNTQARSTEANKKVHDYEDYLLYDKQLGFQKAMGIYAKDANTAKENKYAGVSYYNQYLAQDERLLIAISSSIPNDAVKNYFDSLTEVYTDVTFVMNGFVGNNPKYVQPTLNYTYELLEQRNKNTKNAANNRYFFRVDVNPKIFSKYSLKNVPAIVFVKNYNPYSEIQGNTQSGELNGLNTEEVYIAYGDSNIKYVLEKINKKAKSKGLSNLIKHLSKGYFND